MYSPVCDLQLRFAACLCTLVFLLWIWLLLCPSEEPACVPDGFCCTLSVIPGQSMVPMGRSAARVVHALCLMCSTLLPTASES